MDRLIDGRHGAEQAATATARRRPANPVQLAAEQSSDAALTRLQSAVGNDGMAAVVAGQAPDTLLASFGLPPPSPAVDGGTRPRQPDGMPEEAGGVVSGAATATVDRATPDAARAETADGAPPSVPTAEGTPAPAAADGDSPRAAGGTAGGAARPPADARPGTAGAPAAATGPATGTGPAAAGGPSTQAPSRDAAAATPREAGGETGAAQLDSSSLGLIDEELVEHERWAAAGERVGGASSEDRAAFIATQVGGGAGEGFATGFAMGLVTTIGIQALELGLEEVAGVAIPGVGQVIGGVMSAYALVSGWKRNTAAISRMGEGRSGYEEAANDIEGICAILDIASNIVNVLAGVVGIVAVAAAAAALLTLGALSPLAVAAGSIATAIGVAGMVLGLVKMALQPLALLFRSLHAFTSQADPREIEAQGHVLEEGGKEMGGAFGGLAGAAVGGMGHGEPEEATAAETETPPPRPSPEPGGDPLVVEAEPQVSGPRELDTGGGSAAPVDQPPQPAPGPPQAPEAQGQPQVAEGQPEPPDATGQTPANAAPEETLANLTDEEIEQALAAEPQREATPADFTDEDIDALVSRLDTPEQLETPLFAMSGPVGPDVVNPVTGEVTPAFGLSNMTIEGQNLNPNQIAYHENAYFQGITDVREIGAFPTGPNPELPGPAGAPVPQTELRVTGPSPGQGQPRPVLSSETGGNVEVRYHSANPNAPEGTFSHDNPTVQVDTPNERFPWEGEPVDAAAGERANIRSTPSPDNQPTTGRYRTGEDEWVRLPNPQQRQAFEAGQPMPPGVATPAQVESAHYPVYGEPSGQAGSPPGGGAPPAPTEGGPPTPPSDAPYRHPEQDLPSVLVDEQALGLQPGEVQQTQGTRPTPAPERPTDVDWNDPKVREALGLDPVTGSPTSAKLSAPGQLEVDPATPAYDPSNPAPHGPFHGALGQVKDGVHAPEAVFQVTEGPGYAVRVGPPGAWVDHVFPTLEEAQAYASQLASTGEAAIRETSALPHGWAPDASGKVWPGNPVDAARVLEVPSGTPTIRSVVAPQPEGTPAWGRPAVYGGGGPQTQLPKNLFPRPPAGGTASPAQVGEPTPITDRAEGLSTRLQQLPGQEGAASLAARAAAIERATGVPLSAFRGQQAATLYEQFRARHGMGGTGGAATGESGREGAAEGEHAGGGGGSAPVVEAVNPGYQSPPASRAEIDRLTRDIERLLAARAQAEQREARAEQVHQAAQAQGARVQEARQASGDAVSAVQEHEGEVQQRQQANQQSAQQHAEGGAKVQETASQLAGVATLETLLAGWAGFTGVVLRFSAVLPDRAVTAFHRMNEDAGQFMVKLTQVKGSVAGQQAQQPARGAEIAQTGDRIAATGDRARGTREQLAQTQQRGVDLARANQEHTAYAEREHDRAASNVQRADTAATTLEERRQSLAEQLAAWAAEHRAARRQAIEDTARRLEGRGLRVTRRPER
jgi:hypothetical protein